MQGGVGHPFRSGSVGCFNRPFETSISGGISSLIDNPPIFNIELVEFGDMAYLFMTGLPAWGSAGFCVMGPDELRRQRWTYVKYWLRKLNAAASRMAK